MTPASIMDTWRDLNTMSDIVHLVRQVTGRGYNGTDFELCCGITYRSSEKWAKPQREVPNCIKCLACQR